ncbi:hypothetical protein SSP24_06850 [Streptomyces spinoverrucosus]|uniref:Uncharacterized protein n=1 Tax=Streptomyces spinoverrucosus TaxID=284043 RepID=A0A4Y3VB36_9ACTN|nr:hypothetical protein SSP24_06850 [Streptomyces spinoverrucosus]GHB38698.1 hypothetical protein GCM10010397_05720 [Streptomyces spinoverrucosus]
MWCERRMGPHEERAAATQQFRPLPTAKELLRVVVTKGLQIIMMLFPVLELVGVVRASRMRLVTNSL